MPFKAVHVFRPSLLVGNRAEFRLAERVALSALTPLSFLFAGPFRRYRPIEARVVGERMVAAAKLRLTGVHVHESEQIASIHDAVATRAR